MKHIYKLLLAMLLCIVPASQMLSSVRIDVLYYNLNSTYKTAEVTYKNSSSSGNSSYVRDAVVIPSTVSYNGYTYQVTSIGDGAFSGCSGLTSITIPESVTYIGNYAFYGCSNLTKVTINSNSFCSSYIVEGFSEIERGHACATFGDQVQEYILGYAVERIGVGFFAGCSGMTSITIQSIKIIPYCAFKGCTNLATITIPSSVTSIGSSAFKGCSGLTTITIPANVTNIGQEVFYECSSLESVTVHNSNSVYDSRNNCNAIIETETNTIIAGCKNTTIPQGVTSIGKYAFSGCSGLTSITIPESVTSIKGSAFSDCTGLTSVNIPESVTTIFDYAFSGCSGLKSITIPEGVTSIDSYAFSGCSGLTSITIPKSVTSIGKRTFSGCSGLTSITIPESVTEISNEAFYSCSYLFDVTIESEALITSSRTDNTSLASIFGTQVKQYNIGTNIKSIGNYVFYGCSGLASVTIPNSVTSIGGYAFGGCSSLKSVTMPANTIQFTGQYAFGERNNIKQVYISDMSKWVSTNFLNGNNPLRSGATLYLNNEEVTALEIPNGVETISEAAFEGCKSIKSVVLPSSVTSIGNWTFASCSDLNSVSIPSSVTSIGGNAFDGCTGLSSIFLPEDLSRIGNQAFSGCTNLTDVTIPNNVTSIGNSAFPETSKLYVKRGTVSLIALWKAGYTPYQVGTSKTLPKPYLQFSNSTKVTASFEIVNYYNDLNYSAMKNNSQVKGKILIFSNLMPETSYQYKSSDLVLISKGEASLGLRYEDKFTTASMNITTALTNKTASSFTVNGKYTKGDANVSEDFWVQTNTSGNKSITINNNTYRYNEKDKVVGGSVSMTGLTPNTSNNLLYIVTVSNGIETKDYGAVTTVRTDALKMSTLQPKVISVGNVIVAAETNVDDEEVNVGFEWRRTDWTDDFASNTGGAYLYEGTMEGYIRNLNADKLWKVRPYYLSDSGTYYYGDWMGLDPSNTSYFEPTVHTYAKIQVEGNTALVKGYALRGTDNVTVQGFKYWKTVAGVKADLEARRISEAEIPADAMTVEAKGQVMSASLKDLDYESTYNYVAFVTTTEGETFYGEQQTFQTGIDTTPVIAIEADRSAEATVVERYDMQGRRISNPAKGINILRMSDGTTRKVMVK